MIMKDSLETKLGLFFALGLIAAMVVMEYLGGFAWLKEGYRLRAQFKNVQELKIGDPVKMAGVRVGRVEMISLTDSVVQVTMNLNRDVEVKTDSKVTVKFTGLLGQNYLSVDFGTPTGRRAENNT